MSKTITVIMLLAGATTAYSQGQIAFYNYKVSLGLSQAIYTPSSVAASTYAVNYGGYTVMEQVGSSTAPVEKPAGSTVYSGSGLTGTGYDAQLLAGPAGITKVGGTVGGVGLIPVGTTLNFRSSPPAVGGMLIGIEIVTLPTESYFSYGDIISVAIASWANDGPDGSATTLDQAQADGYAWGISPVEQTAQGLTPVPEAPADLPTTLESFSLGVAVPEPGAITLGVLGLLALPLRRRKISSC
jgi:hypothetical protein